MTKTENRRVSLLIILISFSACIAQPTISFSLPSIRVQNVTLSRDKDSDIVIVFLDKHPITRSFTLHNPERIVVDISDTFIPKVSMAKEKESGTIKRIRIAQNQKKTVRAVVDLNTKVYTHSVTLKSIDGKPALFIKVQKPGQIISSLCTDRLDHSITENTNSASPYKEPFSIETTKKNRSIAEDSQVSVLLFDDNETRDILQISKDTDKESDLSFSGFLHMRTTFQLKDEDRIENKNNFRNRLLLKAEYKKKATVSALSDYLYFDQTDKTEDYNLTLHEAKLQHIDKKYGFSIGNQVVRWGKTDQISPVDSLNPENLRQFIIPEYEERKIPVLMAKGSYYFDEFNIEGVFIPFFKESKIDYFGTNWSIFGHLKKEILDSSLPLSLKNYFGNMDIHEHDPVNESEFAFRLSTTTKGIDMGLIFHHAIEDTPYFKNFPVKNIEVDGDISSQGLTDLLKNAIMTNQSIEVEYKEINLFGFEFETIVENFGLRGEIAWQDNQSFLTSSLTSVSSPSLHYVIGADYLTQKNTYFNMQFSHHHITNYNPETLYFKRNTYSLLGEIRTEIVSDWLQACLKYNITINDNAWYLSPYLKYTYVTNLECRIGAHLFHGDQNTWYGSFNTADLLFLNLLYHF
ncbi:AMIN domain-containing protein [Desulfospira joergensenii]|uniref:AMIN domain-containing protein n=1 Tax=Desulfospira joergensenii TaxID=53329 RepID=UPI0003B32BD7|nr:AMIN domain-containing protein [Desulfospira joergensenii]